MKISKYNKDTTLDTTRNEQGRFMKRRRCAPWILQRYGQRYFLRYAPSTGRIISSYLSLNIIFDGSYLGNISAVSLKISKYNKDTTLDTTRNEEGRFMKRRRKRLGYCKDTTKDTSKDLFNFVQLEIIPSNYEKQNEI